MKLHQDAIFLALKFACEAFQTMFSGQKRGGDLASIVYATGALEKAYGFLEDVPTVEALRARSFDMRSLYGCETMMKLGCTIHHVAYILKHRNIQGALFQDNMVFLVPGDANILPSSQIVLPSLVQMRLALVGTILLETDRQKISKGKFIQQMGYETQFMYGFHMFRSEFERFVPTITEPDTDMRARCPWVYVDEPENWPNDALLSAIDEAASASFRLVFCTVGYLTKHGARIDRERYRNLFRFIAMELANGPKSNSRNEVFIADGVSGDQLDHRIQEMGFNEMMHFADTIKWIYKHSDDSSYRGGRIEFVATRIISILWGFCAQQ